MKIMILSLLMVAGYFTSTQTTSPGEVEIIEYLSDVYNVEESNVELSSPNLVNVRLNNMTIIQGLASFKSCGFDCSMVKIEFPTTTLNLVIGEEISGL